MKNKVIVVGSYNTDLTIQVNRIPKPGETIIGGKYSRGGGGKGANQSVAAARAGADVCFIARVGNDIFGREGIQRLNDERINTRFVFQDPFAPTGVAFIIVDEKGENSIVVASGANAQLSSSDIDSANVEFSAASVLLVQLESPVETIRTSLQKARANGLTVIMNPAPAQPLDDGILSMVDIITPNIVEAEMITGIKCSDQIGLQQASKKFLDAGISKVFITLGPHGVYFASAASMERIPPFSVRPIDSTGAGDVFSGSLAAFLAEGKDVEEAARMANASASISVTRMGAQTCAPSRYEIEQFIGSSVAPETETT